MQACSSHASLPGLHGQESEASGGVAPWLAASGFKCRETFGKDKPCINLAFQYSPLSRHYPPLPYSTNSTDFLLELGLR